MAATLPTLFIGAAAGTWRIERSVAVIGEGLPAASHLSVSAAAPAGAHAFALRGVTSNHRYTERAEKQALVAVQEGLGRPEATRAALIPISKSDAWWQLAQDERRKIFEHDSKHIAKGLEYLPAIARKLYHCRELGEPFDFLTWFEFAPQHIGAFDDLVGFLRQSEEWKYVTREVDLRLIRS